MMPHLMNCPHDPDGWCLDCVKELAESTLPAAAVRDALYESATIRDATIHDALEKLWVDVLRLPTADYSADGDGAKLTKQDVVLKFIADTRAALGLGAEGEKQ